MSRLLKLFCLMTFLIVLHNEYLVYKLARLRWPDLRCSPNTAPINCTSLLLVADPQILGKTFDTRFFSDIALWDSDKYLRTTYAEAFAHSHPHAVAFLGDLMDEGSQTKSDALFETYFVRFKDIFRIDGTFPMIFIPGDNDIGGEGNDYVTVDKLQRFRNTFNELDIVELKDQNTIFFDVNRLTHKIPSVDDFPFSVHRNLRIVLSHMSVFKYPGYFVDQVLQTIKPHVIFSAHSHSSQIITYPPGMSTEFYKLNDVYEHTLIEEAKHLEIGVPTCSYRMGTYHVGYGHAVIENRRILKYTVLWMPNRFNALVLYLIWICVCLLFALVCMRRRCRRRSRHSYNAGKQYRTIESF